MILDIDRGALFHSRRASFQSRVRYPVKVESGPFHIVVLVGEDLRVDSQIARMMDDIVLLADQCRRMYADVILAKEDLVVHVVVELFAFRFSS